MKIDDAANRRRTIARQIDRAMKDRGISRSRLAELMGKTPPYVTKWLSGNHNFTSDTLAELSQVLGVNITGVETPVQYDFSNTTDRKVCESDALYAACAPGAAAVPANAVTIAPSLLKAVRMRASSLGKSVDDYIGALIHDDLDVALCLPKVSVPMIPTGKVRKYAGILGCEPVSGDEKFDRIWNR